MAAYPSFPQMVGSTVDWVDDLKADRAVNGSVKVRAFYSAKKKKFNLKHQLTPANVATLQSFYDTNRLLTCTLTWAPDGQTYTVLFDGAPKISPHETWSDVEVKLVEQ